MVASGAGAPSLEDVEILLAPDGMTLQQNLSMARGQWLRTRLIVGTCFSVDHNTSDGSKEFGEEMLMRETAGVVHPLQCGPTPPDTRAHPPPCADLLVELDRGSVGKDIRGTFSELSGALDRHG